MESKKNIQLGLGGVILGLVLLYSVLNVFPGGSKTQPEILALGNAPQSHKELVEPTSNTVDFDARPNAILQPTDGETFNEEPVSTVPDCDEHLVELAAQIAPHEARILTAAHYLPEQATDYSMASRATIDALVAQGDTAAMLALAELEAYAARGFGEEANWPARLQMTSADPPFKLSPDEQSKRWGSALRWYYAAALNGRAMALIVYGRTLSEMGMSPVDVGWISEADFETLSDNEKRALSPSMVYIGLARQLAPEAYNWAMQPSVPIFPESQLSDLHERILDSLADDFFDALGAGGHSVPESIVASFPVYSELMGRSCTSVVGHR
jgi:hypothetical protein